MYVEWWMGLIFLAWWFISVIHITKEAKKAYFADGVTQGTESTLKILQKNGIIRIDGENIVPVEKV